MKTDFWVLQEKYTGLFYKKYSWRPYYEGKLETVTDKMFTPDLGKARIFPSEAVALNSIPHFQTIKLELVARHYRAEELE